MGSDSHKNPIQEEWEGEESVGTRFYGIKVRWEKSKRKVGKSQGGSAMAG